MATKLTPSEARAQASGMQNELNEALSGLKRIQAGAEALAGAGIVSSFGNAARATAQQLVTEGTNAKNRGDAVAQALGTYANNQENQNESGKGSLPTL
ncbi:hypothetical protein MUG78_17470 [Gordonia alkaliphila]|uniref:hypothetical protein n=1 Tax=Gordonia alkaliphila TaxID=1053547 RepID=UPI001FF3D895|nr:hypothetical protein [Gordonia alkaliphila]MCK0441191.1 hypothetical protein [Gordonia alkaliphila]